MKRRLAVALIALAALAPAAVSSRPQDRPALAPLPARPRLVLFVVVDQMRYDYLTRFEGLFRGGLRRILDRGAVFENARFHHANTETGPGHALLSSGREGNSSGIIANEWWDRRARAVVNVVEDPVHSPLGGGSRGASPANFIGFTVGDALKKVSPASRVLSASFKDRAAVLMGGRRADAAFWFDDAAGGFVSSTYYMSALPDWLTAWQRRRPADRLQDRSWTRLLPDVALYERLAGPDAQAGEWDGVQVVFPHALRAAPPQPAYYGGIRRTPFADELLLDVVLRMMDAYALGRRPSTDLLFVGFSSTDGVGHTFGPDSQEAMDSVLRLDRALERLFDAADRASGGRTLVVLGSDHGSMPLVEVLRRRGEDARRVPPAVIEEAVTKALSARFPGAAGLVAHYDAPHFYLDGDALRRHGLKRRDVEGVIAEAALSTGVVERVFTAEEMLGDPPSDDPAFDLMRASFFEPRSPDVIVRLKPYVLLDSRAGGTGHGSPHEYDRHVPVAFMGAGIRARRSTEPCGPEDVAPTLAALLGIPYPLEAGQRLLSEVAAR